MNIEKRISDIEQLERIFALPDTRPLRLPDREAANRKHDEMYAANPWFRLWQRYGVSTSTQRGSSWLRPGLKFLNCL